MQNRQQSDTLASTNSSFLFNKSEITISQAKPGDMNAIASLTKYMWEDMYATCEDNIFTDRHIAKLKDMTNAVIGVAKLNGSVIGFYKLIVDKQKCELKKLYLNKKYHGLGVGSKLMRDCMQQAIAHNKNSMTLEVWSENPHAILFYKKHGFDVIDKHNYHRPDGSISNDTNNLMRCTDLSAQLNLTKQTPQFN